MDTETWLRRRTYRGDAFDAALLARMRDRTGTRVSVVVPALNAEGTVGEVLSGVRDHWMGPGGLVDELLVIDSRSEDGTAARAREAGATVVQDHAVRPDLGTRRGKGEAMWKSLFVATGDLVLWMDADIVGFDPAYVPGMLGPLLTEPDVVFVKAAYARRWGAGDDGGRVTEICARPLLHLVAPALAGLAQPLAGEQAGRRDVLRRVPFAAGYAVELCLLRDIHARCGLGAIAQVELTARTHVNQSTAELGRMAYAIMRAALDVPAAGDTDPAGYRRPVREEDGTWVLRDARVPTGMRPPVEEVADATGGPA